MSKEIKKSEEYLKSVLSKGTGFVTPVNYFHTVENRAASVLVENELPKETGFKIPDNYLEEVETKILAKLGNNEPRKIYFLRQRWFKDTFIVAAASVVLLICFNYAHIFSATQVNFNSLAQVDIENWVIENSNELSNEDFAALLNSEITNENDFALTDLSNGAIEDYIIYSNSTSLLNENY